MEQLIDALGGPTVVANALGEQQNTVSNWKQRGIPWRWRPMIAQLATDKKVSLPADFLNPKADAA